MKNIPTRKNNLRQDKIIHGAYSPKLNKLQIKLHLPKKQMLYCTSKGSLIIQAGASLQCYVRASVMGKARAF
jgi:hypothetical protein